MANKKRKADSIAQDELPIKITKEDVKKSKSNENSGNSKKKFSKNDKPPQKKFNKTTNTKDGQKPKFKSFQKGNFDKSNKHDTDKPPDWNEFKKEKKELRIKRKKSKNTLFEVISKAKQIGETLRQKTLEGGKEQRDKLVNELHQMLGGQGNYVKLIVTHDMARIVQYMLKFGNQKIREELATEIIPSTVTLIQSKYGRYCIKRLFKYGNAKTRSEAIKAMYGHAVKLASHAVSAQIFEYAYSTWAQPIQKLHLIQEFFGDLYKQSKDDNVKHLRDIYKNSPDMKTAALGATKANLSRILNKDLLDSGLVQSVLYQYITECNENDRNELITQLAPHSVVLSNSKDGSRTVMECIWHGTNKERKVIMKAIKENVLDICKHEHGHTVLIALLDAIDDTVLLNKTIICEIIKNALDIAKDEWGRKVILWLVAPGHSSHFHPTFVKELESGRQKSTSKKTAEVRRQEILKYSQDTLLNNVTSNTNSWFENASISVVALAVLKAGDGQHLSEALSSVAKMVVDVNWTIRENDEDVPGIEHTGLHMTLKKLIQNDKIAINSDKATFSEALCNSLNGDTIKAWVKLNRGSFLLVAVLENGGADVINNLRENLKPLKKSIQKEKTAGAKILLKKL